MIKKIEIDVLRELTKSTLLPSRHVLNRADVADWVLVAPRAENGTVSKISNQIIFVLDVAFRPWSRRKTTRMEGSAMHFWPGTHRPPLHTGAPDSGHAK